jgi:hypothetical protein
MKENYLWDKTGEDSEIKRLENALKEFRTENTTAPLLPAKTFVLENNSLSNQKSGFSFKFALAAFACLGLIIISVGIFQILNIGNQDLAQNTSDLTSEESLTKVKSSVQPPTPVEIKAEPVQPVIEKTKFVPPRKAKRTIFKASDRVQPKVKSNPVIAQKTAQKSINNEPKVKTVKLTKEEKEAYQQLMEALAITGSQMRIVQEKINGVDYKKNSK